MDPVTSRTQSRIRVIAGRVSVSRLSALESVVEKCRVLPSHRERTIFAWGEGGAEGWDIIFGNGPYTV